jgi:hypothetical protein
MVQLLWMEDPVKWVFTVKFVTTRHINADIRLIATESGPDFSAARAEGDGRSLILTQLKMGPAQQAGDHLNREIGAVDRVPELPQWTVHSHKMIPQDGDEAVFRFISRVRVVITRQ